METKYPTLRRPKRKLCYFTNKESSSKQWTEPLALEDVERMFDDLDPTSNADDDLLPSSPVLQISDSERNHTETDAPSVPQEGHQIEKLPNCKMDLEGDVLLPAQRSLSPKLDIDFDLPFKAHAPVKTSSPIDKNMAVEGVEELDSEKDKVVSPILFACDDEGKEEAKTEPLPTQTPKCNGPVTEEGDDSDLESPPGLFSLSKPKMSSHKNRVEGSSEESHPVKEKAPNKPDDVESNRKAPRQGNADPPVSAVSQEPEVGAPKKVSDSVCKQPTVEVSNRQTSFLQKLREAGQPKPASSRKFLSTVKAPVSSELEDDFLILDDAPVWFSIPSKTATTKRKKQSQTSSTDKDSSTDKGVKDSSLETEQKQQEFNQTDSKLGNQIANQKKNKIKKKDKKKNEAIDPGNNMEEMLSPEDRPKGDLVEQEKPNKKKQRLKKVSSEESDKVEEKPKDTASRESDEEQPTLKVKKKAQKSSDVKRSKSSKDGNENAKTSKTKSVKGTRKATQESGAENETEYVDVSKRPSQNQSREEHPGPLSDKEIMISEEPTDEKDKPNQLPGVCEESSSENSQILGKRKRNQPGLWWLSRPQSSEETKVSDNQPKLKKAKQNNKEPSAALLSPIKTKKSRVLKKRNQTPPAPSPNHNTNKVKEKRIKGNKKRNTTGDVSDKTKPEVEAEQIEEQEEQQEVLDQDLDDEESSPLVLAHRDHSLNSGDHVFQRVYHHTSTEKTSKTAAPVSSRGPREQLRAADTEKRRRKRPSNWWEVNGPSEDVESISSQPQQQELKPRKERKKKSKQRKSPGLRSPKKGKMAASSEPLGGAPVPPPLSAPKTIKQSLATFKDIFTSATETPTAVSRREAGQNNRRKASKHPAVDVTVTYCSQSKTDEEIPGIDAGESNSPPNHEVLQDSQFQSNNMLKSLRSGPSSMIELEQYEDEDNLILPSSSVNAVLSASDLCGPPLKPLVLQLKDKANLTEWFKSLWSTTVENGPEITPDQFDWYFHQGRAIGFLVDLNTGSICNGKILLGSYMKKPLWVDHSATTVFNLLTSSVSVTINGCETRYHPGQSFMVSCGHAYSIQNVTAQPAVLYFTRIWAESLD